MPSSAKSNTGSCLPVAKNKSQTGKANSIARPESQVAPGDKSRKTRIKEDIDPDYAEEAEDFFYGEGM